MSFVEEKYNESLSHMTGTQRVERMLSLFASMKEMLKLKISREYEGLSPQQLQKKIAQQLYLSDKNVQKLIDMIGSK